MKSNPSPAGTEGGRGLSVVGKIGWPGLITAILPFFLGGFFEWGSCLLSVLLTVILTVSVIRRKTLVLAGGVSFWAVTVLPLAFLGTVLWAQDKGMALPGFFKFLPLLLFVPVFWQAGEEQRKNMTEVLPWSGVLMTVISIPLSYLSVMKGHLMVDGRQAGFFEYPNTFALFLLMGLIVIATRPEIKRYHLLPAGILLTGILMSGSRAVMILTLLTALTLIIAPGKKVFRLSVAILVGTGILAAGLYIVISGQTAGIGRLFSLSLKSSTLLGRLLYAKDALPVILKHPFGLGYRSYFYMQGSFQTGVYTVQTVHNDLLQLMLDAGWLPAILMVWACLRTLFGKKTDLRTRLLLGVISLHALFDFSLQYMAVLLPFAALLQNGEKKVWRITGGSKVFALSLASVLVLGSLYFGTVNALCYLEYEDAALSLDPSYTDGLVSRMRKEEDVSRAAVYAERILALDPYVSDAWRVSAAAAYSGGDMGSMISMQKKAIANAPYTLELYTDYLDMLTVGIGLYEDAGDTDSADYCRKQLKSVPVMLENTRKKTSELAYMIQDQPELTLPEEYTEMIDSQ